MAWIFTSNEKRKDQLDVTIIKAVADRMINIVYKQAWLIL